GGSRRRAPSSPPHPQRTLWQASAGRNSFGQDLRSDGGVAMIGRLNHVAIVVPDVAAASATYRQVLGARVSEPCPLPVHGVSVVFVELPNTKIELLEPLGPASPVKACR